MLTDDELIDQIRSELRNELSNLHPPPALVGQVWPEARSRRRRPREGLGKWRAGGRALAFAVSTLAAVSVAALGIVLVGHGRTSRPQTGAGLAAIANAQRRVLGSATELKTEMRALRGHPVVIMAWGTWCRPCTKQLPVFTSAWARYRHRVAFLGVDIDDATSALMSYLVKHPVGYPNYRATLGQLRSIVRVSVVGLPATFFIGPTGKVVYSPFGSRSLQALRREVDALLPTRAQQLAQLNEATARSATSRSSRVRIAASLLKYFAVFRHPGRDVNSMPPELARSSADQGLDVADAVLVPVGPGTGTWVIPGATQVCIFDNTGAGVCNSPTSGPGSPAAGGFLMRSGPSRLGRYSILGLVPDGNHTVTISLGNGSRRTVPVVDNVYSVSGLPAAPTAVELKNAAGADKIVTIG